MAPRTDLRTARAAALALAGLIAGPAAAEGALAFVTTQNGDALSVIDLDAREERTRWEVPGQPAGVAVSAGGAVFAVSPESKTVRRFGAGGEVQAEAVLDGGPIGIALDETRGRAFVSDWYNARIWVLDAATLALTGTLATGAAPAGLAVAGGWLASADRDADRVSLFDLDALGPPRAVPVGARPFGLAFAPDGRLFVANVGTNDVSVVDPASGTVTATLPVGERPYGIAFARGRTFVTNQYADSVSVIDLATLEPVATLDVGEYPEGIDATADGSLVVVANWFSNTVTLIDPAGPAVTGEVATGEGPRAFGLFILDPPS